MRFQVRIDVTHLPGVLDPAGATVERALPALGYDNVSQLSIAKTIRLELEAESEEDATAQVHDMCERLLANPVIEQYTVEIAAVEGVPAASMNGEPA
jgi:phosphoribosylformylglycinamidine synthase